MAQFDDLSDYDFELLVADLLGAELGRSFETFPRGRDGGVDLRARLRNGLHLVQCKHYARSSFSSLRKAAEKERRQLVERGLKPRRYTFVTSRRLTAANKATLQKALAPFARNEKSILGDDDLSRLLRRHPKVERAHVKLWLRGTGALERIINSEVHARSEALVADILATVPRYVQTESFADAHAILREHNVVIVAGPPGVGKTTLARLLLLDAVQAGYIPYTIQASVSEAWRTYRDDEAQVFFFDDFLGRTALFDSGQGDPRDLASFIGQIRRSSSSRLVLATREYVLQQAQLQVEDLHWQQLDADKYALTLARYSRFDRARILYNHIYFSPAVDKPAIDSLLRKRGYLDVINHPSYSPRLIEWMTGLGGHTLSAKERRNYTAFCTAVLDDPHRLWLHAYSRGLGINERCLLLQLLGLPANVAICDLERSYRAAARVRGIEAGRGAFEAALKVIQDSFVGITDWGRQHLYVRALNPSLIDFLKAQILDEPAEIAKALDGCTYFDQTVFFYELAKEGEVPETVWALQLGAALTRTFDSRTSERRVLEEGMRQREGEHVSERLLRIAGWCKVNRALVEHLRGFVVEVLQKHDEDIVGTSSVAMASWSRVIAALDLAGFDVRSTILAIKTRVLSRSDSLCGFEALRELHSVEPPIFTVREWAGVQDRFATWAGDCLDEAAGWFDDMEEFERFETTATALGVSLDEDAVGFARDEMYEVQAEREADANSAIDPDFGDTDGGTPRVADWEQIDALFSRLGS